MNLYCNNAQLQSTEEAAGLHQLWAFLASSIPFCFFLFSLPLSEERTETKPTAVPHLSLFPDLRLIPPTYILRLLPSALFFPLGIATILLTYNFLLVVCIKFVFYLFNRNGSVP